MDARGLHGACHVGIVQGCHPRHAALEVDVTSLCKALQNNAGVHNKSVLEPVEIDRGDGKRPEWITYVIMFFFSLLMGGVFAGMLPAYS